MSTSDSPDYILTPFCIVTDTREQSPWRFEGYRCDSKQQYKPLIVRTKTAALRSGDYSIEGCESRVAVERKSLADAFSTFCQGRDRFERELDRLNQMEFAAVVIEAGWGTILNNPPEFTKFSPKSFYRSVIAWQVRFPKVAWWACDTRGFAERTTLRLLERFWLDDQARLKKESEVASGS